MDPTLPSQHEHLPDAVVRSIATLLVQNESPGNTVLHLLAMAGVCRQWRALASEVPSDTPIAFDGVDNALTAGQATMYKFRKCSSRIKHEVFLAAASLFTGYTSVTLTGDCINDAVLRAAAAANGPALLKVKLASAGNVTDEGLWALASAARRLQELHLEEVGRGVSGTFLPPALHHCRQLQALHIEGAAGIAWSALAWWPVAPLPSTEAPLPRGVAGAAAAASEADAAAALSAPEISGVLATESGGEDAGGGGVGAAAAPASDGGWLSSDEADTAPSPSSGRAGARSGNTALLSRGTPPRGGAPYAAAAACGGAGAGGPLAGGAAPAPSHRRGGSGAPGGPLPPPPPPAQQEALPLLPRSWASHRPRAPLVKLARLHVCGANVGSLQPLLVRMPCLTDLELDGPARNIQLAAVSCPTMRRVSYLVSHRAELESALWSFTSLTNLRALELIVRNMVLSTDHLKVLGMLPVNELRIDSHAFKQQPTLSRPQYSHIDNEGVKGLVDAICTRLRVAATAAAAAAAQSAGGGPAARSGRGGAGAPASAPGASSAAQPYEPAPLKLSLCGATALSHEAVSALLRLPILTELDIGGCCKITAMDKMRLVAKVKAGRELLEGGGRGGGALQRALRFPGLLF